MCFDKIDRDEYTIGFKVMNIYYINIICKSIIIVNIVRTFT